MNKFTYLAIGLLSAIVVLAVIVSKRGATSDDATALKDEAVAQERQSQAPRSVTPPDRPGGGGAADGQAEDVNPDFTPPPVPEPPPEIVARANRDFHNSMTQRLVADLREAPFFQALSNERQRQVADAISAGHMRFHERISEAASRGQRLSPRELASLHQQTEQEIEAILNDEEFEQYTEHRDTAPDRNIFNQVNSQLVLPMSEEAGNNLMGILREERERMLTQTPAEVAHPNQMRESVTSMSERVLERAGSFLGAEEIEALDTTLRHLIGPPRDK